MKMYLNFSILLLFISTQGLAQTLGEYFRIAAENNPGLQAKYKDFEASMQRVPQVSSLPDPTLSIGYFLSPVETRVGPQRARFSLSQMFPWFGTLRAQEEAATLMAEARFESFMDSRNRLYYQVASAYYPLYELNKLREIEQENVRILDSYKTIATSKFENGAGSLVDILRVDIMLNEAVAALEILNQKEKSLLTRFNKLLNRPADAEIFIADSLQLAALPEEGVNDPWLVDHPVLNELELKQRASEANEQAAIKQGLPKLGVGLDYVIVGTRTDMVVPDAGRDVVMPMVSVSLPILRSKYTAARKEAKVMQESYALQKEEASNSLVSAFEMTWFEVQQQEELIRLYDQQILGSQQSLNLLFSAYGNSGREFEEVLQMQQQLLSYRKMKISALTRYHTALAELEYLTAKTR